ncbi:MAG: Small ribosomal subunit biogenesis GTPase RsgA [Chloroflexi bacterium]|nr:Small ribosomal subunit biogenesis GTPase RsgA [Chloroflexota bacterium]
MSEDNLRGRIIRAQSGFFVVATEEGEYSCKLRGRLKQGPKTGDIVAVGDWVQISRQDEEKGMIEEVEPRRNMIYRMDPRPQGEYQQIIIANPDQAVYVYSCAEPEPRLRMLDRLLVVAEKERTPAIIVANKVDLTGMEGAREYFGRYEKIGYPVIYTSVEDNQGIEELGETLAGKVSFLAGPSGAGKSSLLNAIQPGLGLAVRGVSQATKKGRHTTVFRELFPLEKGGYVGDTPGLKALDLWDTTPEEVDGYFPEIHEALMNCRFSNCAHRDEPGCAVKEAIEKGEIHPERYQSYLRMRKVEEEKIPWF